jgi:hypothetical protein
LYVQSRTIVVLASCAEYLNDKNLKFCTLMVLQESTEAKVGERESKRGGGGGGKGGRHKSDE